MSHLYDNSLMSENRTSLSANGVVGSLRRRITTHMAPHIRGGKLDFIDRTCRASCCVLYVYYMSAKAMPAGNSAGTAPDLSMKVQCPSNWTAASPSANSPPRS